jgi:hypothetical protein
MSIGKEARREEYLPSPHGKKDLSLMNKGKKPLHPFQYEWTLNGEVLETSSTTSSKEGQEGCASTYEGGYR